MKRVVTRRRRRPFWWGLVLGIGGLLAVLLGAFLFVGSQVVQIAAASDRAELPDPLVFDAESRTYSIILMPYVRSIAEPFFTDPVAHLDCVVTRSDGSIQTVNTTRQGIAVESSFGKSLGTFTAVAGRTSVACTFDGSTDTSDYYVAVAPHHRSVQIAAITATFLGLAGLSVGVVLVIIGVRGKAVVVSPT